MKKLLLIISLLLPFLIQAQSISGYVKDSVNGKPIFGVNLTIGTKGTITDETGFFSIENISGDLLDLKISCIGYITKHKQIDSSTKTYEFFLTKNDIYLDEVVVSATRTENRISQIPGRINMISSEKLSLIAAQSIDEYLQLLPGVQVSRSFGIFSTKSSVTMRGLSGNEQARTLVLVDGVPVNKADGGSVNWNLISTGQVERVEVVKGPGSALYGGNAMGGVINVITLKPTKPFQGNISVEEGSFNTNQVRVNIGGKLNGKKEKGFYWSANGYYCYSDGYITQSEADRLTNPFIVASNVDEKAVSLKSGYFNGEKFNVDIDFSLYDGIRGTGEKVYQPNGNQTEYLTYQARTNLNGKIGGIKWNSSLFYIDEHYLKVNESKKDDYTWYNVNSIRRDLGILTSVNYTKGKHSITSGVDVRNGQVDASDIYYTSSDKVDNNGKMNFFGFYVQNEYSITDQIKLLAGIRYDMAKFYDGKFKIYHPTAETTFLEGYEFSDLDPVQWGAFSPRISLQYKPSDRFRVYGGYSRGFRPSVLDDLCRTGRVKGGLKVADPNLKPEYLDNFEVGGDIMPLKNLKFAASAYYSLGSDFLYYVSTGDSIDMGFGERPIMIRANISNVQIYGGEFELNYNLMQNLSVFGNYAYTHSQITGYKPRSASDPINLKNKFLTDIPQHSFAFGTFAKTKYFNVGITCRYNGSMYVNDQNVWDEIVLSDKYPSWFTTDLKLSFPLGNNFYESLTIQNIFDKKIYDSKGAVGPGRFVTLNLGVKF